MRIKPESLMPYDKIDGKIIRGKHINTVLVWLHCAINTSTQTRSEALVVVWDGRPWPSTLIDMAHNEDYKEDPRKDLDPWTCLVPVGSWFHVRQYCGTSSDAAVTFSKSLSGTNSFSITFNSSCSDLPILRVKTWVLVGISDFKMK